MSNESKLGKTPTALRERAKLDAAFSTSTAPGAGKIGATS